MASRGRPPPRLAAFSRSRSPGQVPGAHGAQEGAESAPGRVRPRDQVALQDVGEEILGPVLRLLGREPAVTDEGVDGVPVRLAQHRQGLAGLRVVAAWPPWRRGSIAWWGSGPGRDPRVGVAA